MGVGKRLPRGVPLRRGHATYGRLVPEGLELPHMHEHGAVGPQRRLDGGDARRRARREGNRHLEVVSPGGAWMAVKGGQRGRQLVTDKAEREKSKKPNKRSRQNQRKVQCFPRVPRGCYRVWRPVSREWARSAAADPVSRRQCSRRICAHTATRAALREGTLRMAASPGGSAGYRKRLVVECTRRTVSSG